MNYGYAFLINNNVDSDGEGSQIAAIEALIQEQRPDEQNNIRLYEKTLSLCPLYPHALAGLHYLELACGHGIDWVQNARAKLASVTGQL